MLLQQTPPRSPECGLRSLLTSSSSILSSIEFKRQCTRQKKNRSPLLSPQVYLARSATVDAFFVPAPVNRQVLGLKSWYLTNFTQRYKSLLQYFDSTHNRAELKLQSMFRGIQRTGSLKGWFSTLFQSYPTRISQVSVCAGFFLLTPETRPARSCRQTSFVPLILLLVSGVVEAVDRCTRTASRRDKIRSLLAPKLVWSSLEPSFLHLHLQGIPKSRATYTFRTPVRVRLLLVIP